MLFARKILIHFGYAILSLLDNPTLRLEMGRRGRERAIREFSLETMVERLLNLYEASNSA